MAKPDWIKINPTARSNNGSFNVVVDDIGQWSDSNSYELDYGVDFWG